MAILRWCKECSVPLESCSNVSGHRPYHGYRADVHPSRNSRRRKKFFHKVNSAEAWVRQQYIESEEREHLNKGSGEGLLFSTVIEEFEKVYASVRMRGYERAEKYRLKQFKDYFSAVPKPLYKIGVADIEAWISQRKAAGIAIGTINREVTSLKRIVSWAVDRGYLAADPLRRLKHLKGENVRVRWLTLNELEGLINKANQDKDLLDFILIGVNTGFRLSNLMRLEAKDIRENTITASKTKSGEPYDVPLNEKAAEVLERLVSQRPTGPLLNCSGIGKRFRKATKAAGLYDEKDRENNVTIHTLRHTFASHYLQKGVPIFTVQKWLGHQSVQMTQKVYGHLCQDHHAQEIKKLAGIG